MLRMRKKMNRNKEKLLARRFKESTAVYQNQPVPGSVDDAVDKVYSILSKSNDIIVRKFEIPRPNKQRAALIYVDGMVSNQMINSYILHPLVRQESKYETEGFEGLEIINRIPFGGAKYLVDLQEVINSILSGDTVIFLEGETRPIATSTKGWEKRGVEEPTSESVVRGPREGFTETIRINTSLIRRRLKDPNLYIQNVKVGYRTITDVAILHIEGIANPDLLQEVRNRINRIEIDGILESGYIEQFIEDNHWSPFPQLQDTERPDRAVAALLEGKIVILVDGTPFALIAPATFSQFYNSPEDYYERFLIATLIRLIRIIAMFMAILLPSLYIAFSSFHPEMIPSKLVIAMAAGRATVPFPSLLEALLMEVTMEILREASVRLPGPVGPTIGIVGALVVGESAVRAGIVSPIMVIIVSLTTIGSFASPSYSAAISLRMLRFPLMVLAGTLGLYGIMLFLIVIIIHLSDLESFGIPYLTPFAPRQFDEWKDTFYRVPLYRMLLRPFSSQSLHSTRVVPSSAQGIKKGDAHAQGDDSDHEQ